MRTLSFLCLMAVGCGSPSPCETPTPFFQDADNDGWGDSRLFELACDAPAGFVVTPGDCNDEDPEQHPNADDTCDGRDDNCDGVVDEDASVSQWFLDQDGDGIGTNAGVEACEPPPGFVAESGDCDDTDPAVYPNAPEACDGVVQSCGTSTLDERDDDGDGIRVCDGDCDDAEPTVAPGLPELCDGLDNDCDGSPEADEVDGDSDGVFACAGDCNDADPSAFPGATESVADGVDQDCDGLELCYVDGDGDGIGGTTQVLSTDPTCQSDALSTQTGDCDDAEPLSSPALDETPYDGVDNDCDAATSDDDLDGDGWLNADDCDDTLATVNPGVIPQVSYTDVTVDAGLWQSPWDPVLNPALCAYEPMASGASIGDIDGDGFDDLFVAGLYQGDALYRNQGDGTFTDEAVARGIDHAGTSNASVFADFNGDGALDLYVSSMGIEGNRLYINDGTGFFTEEAVVRGVDMPVATASSCSFNWGVSAADVDGDNDLDLLVVQWTVSVSTDGDRNRLFLNDGNGFFTDGSAAAGLDLTTRSGFSPTFGDIDDDGDMDLALAADWGESGLWLNDGAGGFTETLTAGVGLDENGMGSDLGDIDGDGDLDWFVTAIYDGRDPCPSAWGCLGNVLYLNDGSGQFTDGTDAAGLRDGGWGWGAAMFDYDNDGDLDIGHTNGFPADPYFTQDRIRLFQNDGSGSFRDAACETGIDVPGQGRAFLPFDFDNDGDLDLFATQTWEPPRLFMNEGASQQTWLQVRASEPGNPFGIGARVDVIASAGDAPIRRDVHANTSYVGTRPPKTHFGLGTHFGPLDEVRVTFPDGTVISAFGVSANQILDIAR